MEVRQRLGEREVIAPTIKPGRSGRAITKADFAIDTEGDVVRCPMGEETRAWQWVWVTLSKGKPKVRVKRFAFPKEVCRACPRYGECVKDKRRRGRFITLHPQEAGLQAARAFEQTERFREQYRQRVVVEHRLARLVGLGMRQARYFWRPKTLLQLLLAATVANLTLVAGKLGQRTAGGAHAAALCACDATRRAFMAVRAIAAAILPTASAAGSAPAPGETEPTIHRPGAIALTRSWPFRPGF